MSGREGSIVLYGWRTKRSPPPPPPLRCDHHHVAVDPVEYDGDEVLADDFDVPHHYLLMRPLTNVRFFNSFDDDFDDT